MVEILPSLLAADFARLDREIAFAEQAEVTKLHLDVMDGRFVPNISFGPPVIQSIRAITELHLDVHLMIEDPDRYLRTFVECGANSISVHYEACRHLHRTLRAIQSEGVLAGVVLNPATPVSVLDEVLELTDFVLLMSVNPGFGGQQFIPRTLSKVMQLDTRRRELGLHFPIEIDGGITHKNAADAARAGVDWIVAGSSIFGNEDPSAAIRQMHQLTRAATAVRV
ncbi:MAG: ribulose-phosphate 3-epimerase [Acidobacteria bacterium]|nr:ribulose-phosphate 3-epimerase [Acidobacteriota bacterium]